MLGVPVQRPQVAETTALGAAYLAGLAVGYWREPAEIVSNWALNREYQPAYPPPSARPATPAGRKRSSAKGWAKRD